jgi:lysyl-tRNA synthetase class 2
MESSTPEKESRPRDDFRPTADWQALKLRASLLARLREFFAARGFLEVETPLLSADVVVDRHLDPFETMFLPHGCYGVARQQLYLQTSPEFAMKRLMAAGGEKIYQVTRAFRQGEVGRLHNPEFTIVEWYERGVGYEAGMLFLSDLAELLLNRGPAERLTYAEAFHRFVGVEALTDDVPKLRAAGKSKGIVPPSSFGDGDRDAWLDWLLIELVEPQLGHGQPTILCDYPPTQAALAQLRSTDPPVAERFELYVDGIELANGYHELLDANVLRERNRENNRLRALDGKPTLPEESRLLAAMDAGLPHCTGVALGFDRVVMLAAGAKSLAEVLAFPVARA